ncbi:hypothetical protein [Leptospira noguchii]|uniref:Uncharacterized protein n=3 Tax=Leptospira noguchii TaxID=28182 RepID=T0FIX3_9LEPT|nr:hypothetical protein [Leptospira noguchii]EMO40671.1 hypothetical protein LEP1GSC186_4470 [Leptospira noguchii serovar Autumnalis str. ZUN142]EMO55024.1 hypothetical protein LEP1GSC172_2353 [Leptospira noguchii]EQA73318.1 hypothetical protein LEP1GSC059_0513 [Leptospira noguchii serovar Panama str. CZ214]MCH1912949.1 hypothetical protein [Leptospira noguchii]MCH1916688.1 hypothetical protein [Leptospira noguchii]
MSWYRKFLWITVPFLLTYHSIFASEVIELDGNIEENNIKILAALNKFAEGSVKLSKKTKGFKYHYTNLWYSRYSFDIYLGEFAKRDNVSIIRIEAPKYGIEKLFRNYFKEELQKKDAMGVGSVTTATPDDKIEKLEKKSHIISQGLNLISPALSVIYNSRKSPVYTSNDTLMRVSFYLLTDLLIGGLAYYFAMNNNDKKSMMDNLLNKEGPSGNVFETKYGGVVIAALVIPRLYRMTGAVEDTTTHNRLLELSYTFRY